MGSGHGCARYRGIIHFTPDPLQTKIQARGLPAHNSAWWQQGEGERARLKLNSKLMHNLNATASND